MKAFPGTRENSVFLRLWDWKQAVQGRHKGSGRPGKTWDSSDFVAEHWWEGADSQGGVLGWREGEQCWGTTQVLAGKNWDRRGEEEAGVPCPSHVREFRVTLKL